MIAAPTPETLTRHELAGLSVRVVESTDPGKVDVEGTVVGETERTLEVTTDDGTVRLPKGESTFAFELPGGETVRVDGTRLVAAPARRTETRGESPWR